MWDYNEIENIFHYHLFDKIPYYNLLMLLNTDKTFHNSIKSNKLYKNQQQIINNIFNKNIKFYNIFIGQIKLYKITLNDIYNVYFNIMIMLSNHDCDFSCIRCKKKEYDLRKLKIIIYQNKEYLCCKK